MPPTQFMRQVFGDVFFYMLYFQEPGVADADLGADAGATMRRMLRGLTTEGARDPTRRSSPTTVGASSTACPSRTACPAG